MDFSSLTDTDLANLLHSLADRIQAAKVQGLTGSVQSLYAEFQQVAAEYQKRDAAGSLVNLINTVHDAVVGTVQDAGNLVGGTAASLLKPLLVPLVVVGLVLGLLTWVAGKSGAVRIRKLK